jgi:hypothetical protein
MQQKKHWDTLTIRALPPSYLHMPKLISLIVFLPSFLHMLQLDIKYNVEALLVSSDNAQRYSRKLWSLRLTTSRSRVNRLLTS